MPPPSAQTVGLLDNVALLVLPYSPTISAGASAQDELAQDSREAVTCA